MSKKVYGRREPDPERLRLLEAVAEAARTDARIRFFLRDDEGMPFAEYVLRFAGILSSSGQALVEALAALEANVDEPLVLGDGLWCPRCSGIFHDAERNAHPERFWECPLCHVVQHKACRGPLLDEHELQYLRLLEAVAEAMLAANVAYGLAGDGPAAQLDEAMAERAELLAQLGELYYSTGEGKILEAGAAAQEELDEKE